MFTIVKKSLLLAALAVSTSLSAQEADLNNRIQRLTSQGDRAGDYRVGPGDLLEINIFGVEKFNNQIRISSSGNISMPFLGKFTISGMTGLELEEKIEQMMTDKKLLVNPQVSVFVKEYRSQPVYVLGSVKNPGQYMITQTTKVVDALAMAGGLDQERFDGYALLRRRETKPEDGTNGGETTADPVKIDLVDLLERGNMSLNHEVQGGDVLQVPEREITLFFIIGDVGRAGPYEFPVDQPQVLLTQALAWAGGPQKTAKLSKCLVIRYDEKGGRTEMQVDIDAIMKGRNPEVEIKPKDVIFIPGSAAKTIAYGLLGVIPNTVSGMTVYRPYGTSSVKVSK